MSQTQATFLCFALSACKLCIVVIAFLQVIETTKSHPELEKKYLQLLQETNPDLYSPQFTLDGKNALHIAAAQGFTDLAKQILVRGYTNLLWAENKNHMYPIQTAVEEEHFRTAEVLLRSTKDRLDNCLFVSFLSDAHSIICDHG